MFRFTRECASSEYSYGSMAFKYSFSFAPYGFSFGFLNSFFCVFTQNLGYGYISGKFYKTTQKNLSTDSLFCRRRRRIYFFFKLFSKIFLNISYSQRGKKLENILPLFSIISFFSFSLLSIKLPPPEMLSLLIATRFDGEKG